MIPPADAAPPLTVGMCFVNDIQTFPLAVKSVFAQSRADWDLILVDDGSRDGTLELARAIDDSRVRVISDGRALGLPARLNEIAQAARSPILFRMDSDDMMVPSRLERQAEYFALHPDTDLVGTAAYALTFDNAVRGMMLGGDLSSKHALFQPGAILHPTVAARRDWFLANPYDVSLRFGQDKELWLRAAGAGTYSNLTEALLFYRLFGTHSARKYRAQKRVDRRLLAKYGPRALGRKRTAQGVAAAYLKSLSYSVAHRAGIAHRLQDRATAGRVMELDANSRAAASGAFQQVVATTVPGWP